MFAMAIISKISNPFVVYWVFCLFCFLSSVFFFLTVKFFSLKVVFSWWNELECSILYTRKTG